jgi:Ca2+-transporting ATPase
MSHRISHTETGQESLERLNTSSHGISQQEALQRLQQHGRNLLPQAASPSLLSIFFHQFASPLIYVLALAALLSLFLREWSDAGFIAAILLLNAIIGTFQEYSAQRAADALKQLMSSSCRIVREGDAYEVDAEELVPGDIVLLESGDRVPADIRLLSSCDLELDESLLTGESQSVLKNPEATLAFEIPLGDRVNMAFTATLVNRGRGRGVVVDTALDTELGLIASEVLGKKTAKPPLLRRMEVFTHWVAVLIAVAVLLLAAVALARGTPLSEIFMLAVALAVSAIPEGLPVALTIALAVGMRRMAKRNVIIRQLMAVESLGSCTFIATDKTGTLTINQLTARQLFFYGCGCCSVTGDSLVPDGTVVGQQSEGQSVDQALLERLCRAAVRTNEGFLGHRDGSWVHHGDAVDVALLVMAHKVGVIQAEVLDETPEVATIPFESEHQFSASLNLSNGERILSVKGALERLLPMCSKMAACEGDVALDQTVLMQQAQQMASQGYRVIAIADGEIEFEGQQMLSREHLQGLTLLGLVGMIDPLRPEAKDAIASCRDAGIKVAMITGDHPATALSIAQELGLAKDRSEVVTGLELRQAKQGDRLDEVVAQAVVFARVEPSQKLEIIQSLQQSGHFVAMSGDGANDAPALRAAEVGVAMGRSGSDVARETAELILTDDNFTSIVAGIEEGRVAYANVRKVIFLLISTGAAELVLFALALLFSMPLPLVAVQLLWLNLVTNGIQDVALAFEPAEGHELNHPPRPPKEPIFNRLMVERVILSALVIGTLAFVIFWWLLEQGYSLDEARNGTLLLLVLFENIHAFNSRSESRSVFSQNPLANPLLLFGIVMAQLVHIGAMYTPWLNDVLGVQPISAHYWGQLLLVALILLVVMEGHKLWRARRS